MPTTVVQHLMLYLRRYSRSLQTFLLVFPRCAICWVSVGIDPGQTRRQWPGQGPTNTDYAMHARPCSTFALSLYPLLVTVRLRKKSQVIRHLSTARLSFTSIPFFVRSCVHCPCSLLSFLLMYWDLPSNFRWGACQKPTSAKRSGQYKYVK